MARYVHDLLSQGIRGYAQGKGCEMFTTRTVVSLRQTPCMACKTEVHRMVTRSQCDSYVLFSITKVVISSDSTPTQLPKGNRGLEQI